MITSTRSACLFGGALVTAGLASPAAADFVIGGTTHNSGFVDGPVAAGYAGGGDYATVTDIGAASGPTSASVSFATGTSASALLSATEMSGQVTKVVPSFGYFSFLTEFMVSSDTDVLVSWDVDSAVSTGDRTLRIFSGIDTTVFEYDAVSGPHSGSMTVSLEAGVEYTIDATYRSTFANGGGSFSVVIPAPGTLALVPLVGIAAVRRRR